MASSSSTDPFVALRDLSYSYPQAAEPLLNQLSVFFPQGFTGVVGVNGVGKSTLLRLLCGELVPESGEVVGAGNAVYCEQRTDEPPASLSDFLEDWDAEAFELRGRLKVEPDFLERWPTLSHGERKRAQIACALWQQPELLALDEPTNHIDAAARALLADALGRFGGVGIVVSHDRELLDQLCVQCVWLSTSGSLVFPGGYTEAKDQYDANARSVGKQRATLLSAQKKLQTEVVRRRDQANAANAKRSKRGIAVKDSDARDRIDRARVSGKDGQAGRQLRQLGGRAEQSAAKVAALQAEKEYATGIWLNDSVSRRQQLFVMEDGEFLFAHRRTLQHPQLLMRPRDRIAIVGPNGAGKSTLLRRILQIPALAADIADKKVLTLPQEISADDALLVLEHTRALPNDLLGHAMNIVSRLGSRPKQLLASNNPSPGEVRKLWLALGMVQSPHLLVLDEPTNHLDLPSIEALQTALAHSPCGLLFVSHDKHFVDALAETRWVMSPQSSGDCLVTI